MEFVSASLSNVFGRRSSAKTMIVVFVVTQGDLIRTPFFLKKSTSQKLTFSLILTTKYVWVEHSYFDGIT